LSYITSLQTQNIRLQPIDLTPKDKDPSSDDIISNLVSNIFSGCDNGSGGYDMWADFILNNKENNRDLAKSESLFTATECPSVPQSEGGGRIRRKRLIKSVLSAMNKIVYKYNTKESCPDLDSDPLVSSENLNNRSTDLKTLLERLSKNSGKLGSWQVENTEQSYNDDMVKYFGSDFENCKSYLPKYDPSKYDSFEFEPVQEPLKDLQEPKPYSENRDVDYDYATNFPKFDFPVLDYTKINEVKPLDYSKILKKKLDNYSTARTLDNTPETPQTSPIIPVSEILQFPPYNFPPLEPRASPFPVPQPVAAPPIPQWLIHTTPPNLTTVMRMTNSNSNTVNTNSYTSSNLNNSNCWRNSPPPGLELESEGPDPMWVNWLSRPNTVTTNRWDASIS